MKHIPRVLFLLACSNLFVTHGNALPLRETADSRDVATASDFSQDMTDRVATSTSAWVGATGTYNGSSPVTAERYQASHYTGSSMYQKLTSMPNGVYDAEVYCNASQAWIGSAVADGTMGCTTLYGNDTEVSVPVYNVTSVSTPTAYTLNDISVTDGTLTLGVRNDLQGANWTIIQIKKLTYKGAVLDEDSYYRALQMALNLYDGNALTPSARVQLEAAINDKPTEGSANSFAEKTAALQAAVEVAQACVNIAAGTSFTSRIQNPDIASTDGWNISRGSGNHDTTAGDPATSGDATPYLDSWAPTWSTQYTATQTIQNLPNGTYQITATVRGNAQDVVSLTGISGEDTGSASNTVASSWQTISAQCVVQNNTLTLQVATHLPDGGWFSADDFTLTYMGGDTQNTPQMGTGFSASGNGLTEAQTEAALSTFAENRARVADFSRLTFDTSVADNDIDNVPANANLLVLDAGKTFKNAIHVQNGALSDGAVLTDKCPFFAPENYTGTLRYTRTMSTTYGTLILPVPVEKTETTTLYLSTNYDKVNNVLNFEETESVPANTPCLFKTSGSSMVLSGSDIVATPETLETTYLTGQYEHLAPIPEGNYIISADKLWSVGENVTIAPFRAYIHIDEANGAKSINTNFGDGATGLENVLNTCPLIVIGGHGKIDLRANEHVAVAVYGMSGKRLAAFGMEASTERSLALPAGIYLVNGTKVRVY